LSIGQLKKKAKLYMGFAFIYMSKKTDNIWHVLPFCFRRMKAAACIA
jgi:hypothetical protein